jgi:hypothetical protein
LRRESRNEGDEIREGTFWNSGGRRRAGRRIIYQDDSEEHVECLGEQRWFRREKDGTNISPRQ